MRAVRVQLGRGGWWEGEIKICGRSVRLVSMVVVVDAGPAGSLKDKKCEGGERVRVCVRERVESNVSWRADCAVLTRVLGRCRVWAVECERRDFVGDRRQG